MLNSKPALTTQMKTLAQKLKTQTLWSTPLIQMSEPTKPWGIFLDPVSHYNSMGFSLLKSIRKLQIQWDLVSKKVELDLVETPLSHLLADRERQAEISCFRRPFSPIREFKGQSGLYCETCQSIHASIHPPEWLRKENCHPPLAFMHTGQTQVPADQTLPMFHHKRLSKVGQILWTAQFPLVSETKRLKVFLPH